MNTPTQPNRAAIAFQQGLAAARNSQWPEAARHFRRACQFQPEQPAHWINCAIALERSGDAQGCDAVLALALKHHSAQPALLLHAGQRALSRDALEAAESLLRQALSLKPNLSGARQQLAVCLLEQQRPEEAMAELERILQAEPNQPAALYNRALALKALGQLQRALAELDQLASHQPDWHGLHTNRAALLLQLGRYPEGWLAYEARFRDTPEICQAPPLPRYTSEAQPKAPLLLVAEQGLGDSLQFLRYGALLRPLCGQLLLAVQRPLLNLASATGLYDSVIALDELKQPSRTEALAAAGCTWLPLISAAALAGAGVAAAPTPPRLTIDAARIKHWKDVLGPRQRRLRIALAWQGNPSAERGQQRGRSVPLAALQAWLKHPDLEWVAVQKGPGSEQVDALGLRSYLHPAQHQIDPVWDFSDIAAILHNCDLLLSSDSAITHLAGAFDLPANLLLKAVPDWRWGLTGEDCHWYPRHRLLRQRHGETWTQTVKRSMNILLSL